MISLFFVDEVIQGKTALIQPTPGLGWDCGQLFYRITNAYQENSTEKTLIYRRSCFYQIHQDLSRFRPRVAGSKLWAGSSADGELAHEPQKKCPKMFQ
jgi:hypothetical protein